MDQALPVHAQLWLLRPARPNAITPGLAAGPDEVSQLPAMQPDPGPQDMPQAPQLFGSALRSTQLKSLKFVIVHAEQPGAQVGAPVQAVLGPMVSGVELWHDNSVSAAMRVPRIRRCENRSARCMAPGVRPIRIVATGRSVERNEGQGRALSRLVGDLKSHRLIIAKGFLFLLMGLMAGALLLADHPDLRTAVLLGVAVWAFCRFYYFAFYVIEKYVDSTHRFAGLIAFVRYVLRRRAPPPA
jgi:hypothetical protein